MKMKLIYWATNKLDTSSLVKRLINARLIIRS